MTRGKIEFRQKSCRKFVLGLGGEGGSVILNVGICIEYLKYVVERFRVKENCLNSRRILRSRGKLISLSHKNCLSFWKIIFSI